MSTILLGTFLSKIPQSLHNFLNPDSSSLLAVNGEFNVEYSSKRNLRSE